ncbi:hybrid sensor histidine kinase/response regulator [Natronospira bacteriovora]|uniref:histidine kinase n=1 Tax=Natronospira bacteriovora TaxID=3069753 RepID=A0ABU0W737_9GAMM|nr:hybrid sensor histidine kinase/response regulator [Natronospira sp. AB-CW4]MDQ2069847.1 two-component regulator propeller domain-containing protein [Natronospira sp. AB-CW4]
MANVVRAGRRSGFGFVILSLFSALFAGPLKSEEAFFLGVDHRDGLPQETVEAVLRDRNGLLWIGTQGGLARWDGHRMQVYRRDPRDAGSLPGNHIRALAEDARGHIWIATLNAGLAVIDPPTGQVRRLGAAEGLASDRVSDLVASDDGESLWVAHPGAGLSRVDVRQGLARPEHPRGLPEGADILSLASSLHGLWIGSADRLYFLANGADILQEVSLQGREELGDYLAINAIEAGSSGPVVVAAASGLWQGHSPDEVFSAVTLQGADDFSPALTAVQRDHRGTVWLASRHGLWRLERGADQAERYTAGHGRLQLPSGALRSLHLDAQGLLWVGSESQGLWRLVRPPAGIRAIGLQDKGTAVAVWAAIHWQGRLWLGTDRHGVVAVDEQGQIQERHLFDAAAGLGENIWALAGGRDALWVGTEDMEIHAIAGTGRRAHPAAMAAVDMGRAAAIWDLLEDRQGQLWISTNGDGLHRYDPASGDLQVWRASGADRHGLTDDRVTRLHEDGDGRLWVGTEGSGLFMLAPGEDRFRHLAPSPQGLVGGMVEAIAHDRRGRIWVASYDGGVARLDPDGRIHHFGVEQGLPSDTAIGLEVDGEDHVWVMTDLGLVRITPEGTVRPYALAQGVPPLVMHVGAHATLPDGPVFAGADGLLRIQPNALVEDGEEVALRITDLRIMGESIQARPELMQDQPAWPRQGIELRHDQPALSLDFALLDFRHPAAHRYRYRLHGLDENWQYSGADRAFATYTNLGPGDYRFELQARGSQGQWQEQQLVLPVRVHPAPWRSPAALIAYALLALLVLLVGLWQWRQWQRRRAVLQREREQRQWVEQLHGLASQLAEPADRHTLLRRFLEGLMALLPVEAARVRLERSGRLPPLSVAAEQPGHPPLSSADANVAAFELRTGRRRLGELHVRPSGGRPLSRRDRAASLAAADQAAQAMDMFLLVAEADAANRAKSAFLAKLSHEIRTPVSGILGLAGLLLRESLEPRSRDYAQAIDSAGRGLMAILSDILDHARIEAGRMEIHPAPFPVIQAVEDTAALHAVAAREKGLPLLVHVSRDIPARIVGDEVRFRQILGNLLSNAVKFTETGAITVELKRQDAARLCLRVSDTGPGMSAEAVSRLFQPFSRAPGSTDIEGNGLGLVICRELARLMGGEISLETDPGQGSCFTVLFSAESDDGGTRVESRSNRPICLSLPDHPAGALFWRRLSEAGHILLTPDDAVPEDALHLRMDANGIRCENITLQAPDSDCIEWPVREARLAEWLDRLSGLKVDPAAAADPVPDAREAGNVRLLLAEDNPVNARVVSDVLANSGYQVDVVGDGRAVLERLDQERFDLVLMDRHMPRLDGLATTRAIRAGRHQGLRVVGLTAAVSSEEHAECRAAGMDAVVVKDGDPGPMLRAIRQALAREGGEPV